VPVSTEEAITEYTRHSRAIIENAWNDNTAHPDYRPLPPELPASYGQCVSASHILCGELHRRCLAQDFRLGAAAIARAKEVA
jgi:hypothetical protein